MIEIKFEGKIYTIPKNKLLYVLSVFENRELNLNEKDIVEYLKKYFLLDEVFLNGISNL